MAYEWPTLVWAQIILWSRLGCCLSDSRGEALPQKSELVLEEVSTTRGSGWVNDQRAKFLLILSPNG